MGEAWPQSKPFAPPSPALRKDQRGMNRISDRPMERDRLDPAADAAAILLRVGFAIFALVVPSATLMSRWVIVVLVPIGAILIILAAILRGDFWRLRQALAGFFASPVGFLAVCLMVWTLMSLIWTPAPLEAADRVFKSSGVLALGVLAAFALPERMRASDLHLVTIGVALGAFLILLSLVLAFFGNSILIIPAATPGRVAVLLTVLVWAAAAWLLIKNSKPIAGALVVGVLAVAMFGPAREALIPMLASLLVFGLARFDQHKTGLALAVLIGLAVLGGPILAGLAYGLASGFDLSQQSILARIAQYWAILADDPLHIITGRGFDAAYFARAAGFIPASAPVGLLADIWFDLGLLGAVGLAGLMVMACLAARRMEAELAPATLAGLIAAFTFAVIDRGATQTWWLNGLAVMGIVLAGVARGRYRTLRPKAHLLNPAEERRRPAALNRAAPSV
jgi:hypothetical protein